MIKSFRHKGLEAFFVTSNKAGIQPHHAAKLRLQLSALHAAQFIEDLRAPVSWRLHQLSAEFEGYWSLTVNGNWRIVFRFDGQDAELVDYLDYH